MIARNLLLADAVDVGNAGKVYVHGGMISRIYAPALPWTQPMLGIFGSVDAEEHDAPGTDHTVSIAFLQPDDTPLGVELASNSRLAPPGDPELPMNVNFALSLAGVVFPQHGLYSVVLSVDDQELRRLPLLVRAP